MGKLNFAWMVILLLSATIAPVSATPEQPSEKPSEAACSSTSIAPTPEQQLQLRSLTDRYGGLLSQSISRYEFAAEINWISDRIKELQDGENKNWVRPEDLTTLKHLETAYAVELATLRNRIAALEGCYVVLESQHFSTTTRLGSTDTVITVFPEPKITTVRPYRSTQSVPAACIRAPIAPTPIEQQQLRSPCDQLMQDKNFREDFK